MSKTNSSINQDIKRKVDGKKFGEGYYSIKSAAHLIDSSEQYFRNLVRDRKITFVKFGRSVRIPATEIEKLKKVYNAIDKEYDNLVN